MTPKVIRKSPCHDCPMRKNSTRGWTGSQTPKEFIVTALVGEHEMPCHEDVDYHNPNWSENWESLCVGVLQMFKNMNRTPQNSVVKDAVEKVEKNDNVFSSVQEYLDYHGAGLGGPEIAGPAEPHYCDKWLYGRISLYVEREALNEN